MNAATLTASDLSVLDSFATRVAQNGGPSYIGCHSEEQLNRIRDTGAIRYVPGCGYTLTSEGVKIVEAYRARPEVRKHRAFMAKIEGRRFFG